MSDQAAVTYPPLNTLKPVAPEVWIVDGPLIEFGMPWPKMPFPTRMTIVRLRGEELFVHSPTPLVPSLRKEVGVLGKVRWIIGPNRIHYWWIPDWRDAFPEAEIFLAPRIREQAKGRIDFPCHEIGGPDGYPWDNELRTLPVSGDFMTEVIFFHPASRTLILTDLIENFEPKKLSPLQRLLTWLGGVQHPDGQMPRDMRLTYRSQRRRLLEAVETMLAWEPERVLLAHGRWYEENGTAELRRAFRWLLD
ncbi:MAG TPA: DUF4336 domain-containing protein [Devosiaceae bacterium]|nr:DUF4336 domain-containing protein [Devosiaceae bacterium]